MNDIFYPYAFFEGKIVPMENAKLSIATNALQYGNAIFGGIRGYKEKNGKTLYIFRLKDHYLRLSKSLAIINKSIRYEADKLCEITLELIKQNKPDRDFYIRPFAYASNMEISPDLSKLEFEFGLYMLPLGDYLSVNKGLKVCVSNWIRISDNMIPPRAKIAGGYINSSLAKADAVRIGCDDALMLNTNGHIAEGSAANFFLVRNNKLITSSMSEDILEGITRNTILKLADDLGIKTLQRPIDKSECYIADEAFLSGTGVQISWISEIDGRILGHGKIGPVTSKIQKLYFSITRGGLKKYNYWLTKI
jgi:branched-chain amino acid aminotransferase